MFNTFVVLLILKQSTINSKTQSIMNFIFKEDGNVGETKIKYSGFAFFPVHSQYFDYKEQSLKQIKIWLKFYYVQYRFTMTASCGFSWVKEGFVTKKIFQGNKKLEKSMNITDYKKWRNNG